MKRITTIALAAIIFIIPTIAAVFFYFFPILPEKENSDSSYGVLELSSSEIYKFNENEHVFLFDFFKSLEENSEQSLKSYNVLSEKNPVSLKTAFDGNERKITLFFDILGESFWTNENKIVYKINEEYANSFFNSQYAKSFYEFATPPTLRISSGQVITPTHYQWKYTLKNGAISDGIKVATTDTTHTYNSTSITNMHFSIAPDVCLVKAYIGNTKKYEGTLTGLTEKDFENEPLIRYEIEAKWEKSSDSSYFGEAKYSFSIKQTKDPIFSVDRTTLMQGEFLTISAKNVSDLSNLSCSIFFPINFTPVFHKNGNDAYALVPFDINLTPDTYILILRYENTQESFVIELTEHDPKIQEDPELSLDEGSFDNMNALVKSIGSAPSDIVYARGTFYNYENDFNDEYYIRLGFGHIKQFGNDKSIRQKGVDFYRPSGENIPALNNGVICKIGEDTILGKYVVVDHGYGVRSWYCHVGEITVSLGKSVIKGDTVARTGMSGLASSPGFFLMTTVYDVPVSPYNFYENNFVFPN